GIDQRAVEIEDQQIAPLFVLAAHALPFLTDFFSFLGASGSSVFLPSSTGVGSSFFRAFLNWSFHVCRISAIESLNESFSPCGASCEIACDASIAYGSDFEFTIQLGIGLGTKATATATSVTMIRAPLTNPRPMPSKRSSQPRPIARKRRARSLP